MKSKRELEDAVVRAAMRFYLRYRSWAFAQTLCGGILKSCTRLAARRRKRG